MVKSKAFTLMELIVVICIMMCLFVFVMLILPKRHHGEMSKRVQCGSQLRGIGQAIALYQNDYRDLNPVVWSKDAPISQFGTGLYNQAYETRRARWANKEFAGWDQEPTIGGCLWLLVKYEDIVPKMFLCPSDDTAEEMDIEDAMEFAAQKDYPMVESWEDLSDFQSMVNLSYSYNDPWMALLDVSASSGLVLMADKNPAYNTETGVRNAAAGDFPIPGEKMDWTDIDGSNFQHGNTPNHSSEVQNVLFADMHVKKHEKPTVGIAEDNIYTYWSGGENSTDEQKTIGRWDQNHAVTKEDSYLGN